MHNSLQDLLLLCIAFALTLILLPMNVIAYTQIAWRPPGAAAMDGRGSSSDEEPAHMRSVDGPRIFKALNADLIFPKVFNSSERHLSDNLQQQQQHRPPTTNVMDISAPAGTSGATTTMQLTTSNYAELQQKQQHGQQQEHQQKQEERLPSSQLPIFVTPSTVPYNGNHIYKNNNTNETQQISNNNNRSKMKLTPSTSTHWQELQRPMQQQLQPQVHQKQLQQQQKIHQSPWTIPQQQQYQQIQQEQMLDQQQFKYAASGRAVDNRPAYQLNQLITPLMKVPMLTQRRPMSAYYTSPTQLQQQQQQQQRQRQSMPRPNIRNQPVIMERYSPGEAVASQQFKHHNAKTKGKRPSASNIVQSYVAPADLYSFPPNSNAKYPSPSQDPKAAVPNGRVNSYIAPPSGPLTGGSDVRPSYDFSYPLTAAASSSSSSSASASASTSGYKYKEPTYLPPPPPSSSSSSSASYDGAANDDDSKGDNDSIGVLPASAMSAGNGGGDDDDDHMLLHSHSHGDGKLYPTPPPGWVEEHPESVHAQPDAAAADMMDDTMMDEGSNEHKHDDHDHDDSNHHHIYPELIFDDHHFDHHDYHHDHLPPAMTTPLPPPPPPPPEEPEPRVKKYSYFYIGRKLWYIPLYFTVWFSFYVLWLIVKSIARHKVNLPNHYVARRSVDEIDNSNSWGTINSSNNINEHINQLTVRVLSAIDKYSKRHYT